MIYGGIRVLLRTSCTCELRMYFLGLYILFTRQCHTLDGMHNGEYFMMTYVALFSQ